MIRNEETTCILNTGQGFSRLQAYIDALVDSYESELHTRGHAVTFLDESREHLIDLSTSGDTVLEEDIIHARIFPKKRSNSTPIHGKVFTEVDTAIEQYANGIMTTLQRLWIAARDVHDRIRPQVLQMFTLFRDAMTRFVSTTYTAQAIPMDTVDIATLHANKVCAHSCETMTEHFHATMLFVEKPQPMYRDVVTYTYESKQAFKMYETEQSEKCAEDLGKDGNKTSIQLRDVVESLYLQFRYGSYER